MNSIEEVRRIARNLHPYQLDTLGLTNIIEGMVERFKNSSDIFVDYSISNIDKVLSIENEINVYRIIQECVNNIIKHSKASSVEILVENNVTKLDILIKDNGIGIPSYTQEEIFKNNSGFGLWGIRERVKYLSGIFNIESSEGKGTTISISIPIRKRDE